MIRSSHYPDCPTYSCTIGSHTDIDRKPVGPSRHVPASSGPAWCFQRKGGGKAHVTLTCVTFFSTYTCTYMSSIPSYRHLDGISTVQWVLGSAMEPGGMIRPLCLSLSLSLSLSIPVLCVRNEPIRICLDRRFDTFELDASSLSMDPGLHGYLCYALVILYIDGRIIFSYRLVSQSTYLS